MINNINQANASWTVQNGNALQQRKKSSQDLFSAIASGDLASAQKAYATLTRSGLNEGSTPALNPNTPIGQIGQALQKGDLASAKSIANNLKALQQNGPAVSKSIQSAFNNVASASSGASKALSTLSNLEQSIQSSENSSLSSNNPLSQFGLGSKVNSLV
jgi:hypothetical protein